MRALRPLSSNERQDLETKLKKAKELGEWKRLFVILRFDEGESIEELARQTYLSKWTIERYFKEYSAHNKTEDDPRGGGQSKLTPEESCNLEKHLQEITYLNVKPIIACVLQKFGKTYSRSGMTNWLQEHGFTHKRPEKIPGKLDPNKQALFIKEYEELKNSLPSSDKIYFLDALHPEYQSQAVCGWIKKGECKTLQTTGKQKRLHCIGALNLNEMKTVIREYETIDEDSMIDFFKELNKKEPEGYIHVILDNAAAHRSYKLMDFLKDSRIKLHYLPPYSPNLNPIERLWKVFRETTLYNRFFETCSVFFTEVRGFFSDKVHELRQLLRERINDNFQIIKLNPIKLG